MKFALKTIALPLAGGLGGYSDTQTKTFSCGKGRQERVLAFGKLQLLLVGSRLHFPSENRKSYSPLKGRFYSFQTVDGASPV